MFRASGVLSGAIWAPDQVRGDVQIKFGTMELGRVVGSGQDDGVLGLVLGEKHAGVEEVLVGGQALFRFA